MRRKHLFLQPRHSHARRLLPWLGCAVLLLSGCEYFVSDVATRIRYALVRESAALLASDEVERIISLRPDHWPDACAGDAGYRLTLSPYQGGKSVPVGDIHVSCKSGGPYYTGMGVETIYVTQELVVDKRADEHLLITLRRTDRGTEIVNLR